MTGRTRRKRKGRCPAPPGTGRNTHLDGGADATRFARVPQKKWPVTIPATTCSAPFKYDGACPSEPDSQFFANVYLNRLDHRLAHEIGSGAYARYVDDLLIFADSKRRLGEIREILELELEGLRLEVHPGKSRIYRCAEGVTFLGWRFFPNRVRLVRGNVVRFRRRMERLSSEFDAGALELSAVKQRVAAWIAHAAYGDTWRLRERLLGDFVLRPPARMPRRG